jgi:AcrR family transcriptional regulator
MTESVVSEPRKRPYHSHVREQQAQETRQRILDIARTLFLSRGYIGTTVDAIAEGAFLSPKTVNAIFGSKRGVFAELVHPSAFGEQYQQLLGRLQADPDPQQRVVLAASITRQVYETFASEFDLLREAATITPELADVIQQIEARRRQHQEHLVTYLPTRKVLRHDLQPKEATDELWALTSYDLYRMLVSECGWEPNRYEEWLANLLLQRLLDPQSYPSS